MTCLDETPSQIRATQIGGPHPLSSLPLWKRGAEREGDIAPRDDSNQHALRAWFILGLLMLAGLLILAHGCHGDEDHELFGTYTIAPVSVATR